MISDEDLVSALEDCASYVDLHIKMSESMGKGYFAIVIARNSGCKINSIDCREDMEANLTVDQDENLQYSEWRSKPEIDPIIYLSGLPPPSLKKSQKLFEKALSDAISLCSIIRRIQTKLGCPCNDGDQNEGRVYNDREIIESLKKSGQNKELEETVDM